MKDWKTSVVGLVVIGVGVIHLLVLKKTDAETLGMLSAGVGLILSKDSKS
jgi:Na+/phosphate symporter